MDVLGEKSYIVDGSGLQTKQDTEELHKENLSKLEVGKNKVNNKYFNIIILISHKTNNSTYNFTIINRRNTINSLKNHNINIDTINILTHTYVNSRYNYSYDISIVVGVNEWNLSCNTVFNHARFKLMILTEKTIDTSMLTKIYNNIPPINNILNSLN